MREGPGALDLARRISGGELGDVQLIVRPHPAHDRAEFDQDFEGLGPRIAVQRAPHAKHKVSERTQDETQIRQWVNTFRHADVVVNTVSTVAIDAAIFDRPIVNLDYDSEPGQPNQGLVKDVNHLWSHYKPIAESGGVWLVESPEQLVHAVRSYLADPSLHREKRRGLADYVCGFTDGRCGLRMAESVLKFARTRRRAPA
ncbi:MAG: CDP-glycerol glycerophosphotransferase family protein [Deltaproteobacteria bacterium]|nr:CDP-glycerol glycerophosphotransferase family protein [Deltaproteobacteria bacterium]